MFSVWWLNESTQWKFPLDAPKSEQRVVLSTRRFHERRFFVQNQFNWSNAFQRTQKTKTYTEWSIMVFIQKFLAPGTLEIQFHRISSEDFRQDKINTCILKVHAMKNRYYFTFDDVKKILSDATQSKRKTNGTEKMIERKYFLMKFRYVLCCARLSLWFPVECTMSSHFVSLLRLNIWNAIHRNVWWNPTRDLSSRQCSTFF